MTMTGARAARYMKDWMNLHAVSSFFKTELHLFATARDRENKIAEYWIERNLDSEKSYNVYTRPINSDEDWEWVDAIPEEEL
jgi:hypothetical protein